MRLYKILIAAAAFAMLANTTADAGGSSQAPVVIGTTTGTVASGPALAAEITRAEAAEATAQSTANAALPKSGGTLTGSVTLSSGTLTLNSTTNLNVNATTVFGYHPVNFFPGSTSVSATYSAQGLSIGWNATSGGGETDFFLGPQGGSGGLNIYQLNGSGTVVSSTPIFQMNSTGNVTIQSNLHAATVIPTGFNEFSSASVTATGTTCATALQLTTQYSIVYGSGGVILPSTASVLYLVYVSSGASGAITVYNPGCTSLGTVSPGAVGRWFAFSSSVYTAD